MTTNSTSFVATAAAAARPTRAELVRSLVEGERRFHQLPKDLAPEEAADDPPQRSRGDDPHAAQQHRPSLAGRDPRVASQLREFHRRGAGADGHLRSAAGARQPHRRRRLRAARHHRGGAGRQHQPRLHRHPRGRRRGRPGRGRGDDPGAGLPHLRHRPDPGLPALDPGPLRGRAPRSPRRPAAISGCSRSARSPSAPPSSSASASTPATPWA